MGREDLIRSFLNGATKGKASSLSIDGNLLLSYATPIARREGDTIYLNKKKYSQTTSTQQNSVRRQARSMGFEVIDVNPEDV